MKARALAVVLPALLLVACAHHPSPLCLVFAPADFTSNSAGVAANGDILTYTAPSVACPHPQRSPR